MIMNCKEVLQAIRFHNTGRLSEDVIRHTESCFECRANLSDERVIHSLLSQQGMEMEPSPFWMNRLKNRIHEMREQGVSSWEAAIVGLRGWITALGAVAILVIAVSLEWSRPNLSGSFARPDLVDHEAQDVDPNSVEELIGSASDAPRKTSSNLYE